MVRILEDFLHDYLASQNRRLRFSGRVQFRLLLADTLRNQLRERNTFLDWTPFRPTEDLVRSLRKHRSCWKFPGE